ncbi:MAG: type II toxin-antitoxin system HigB family toxin [Microscillaceae bacterium]|jgi:mRNA interferase HigB|nr:type II toxin-antitoxin system HigB family toxin [Microscillaceae bacterium]
MRIIAKSTLKKFWEINPQAENPLNLWYKIVEDAQWVSPNDVKQSFGNASMIGDNRIIFNIKGNDYRLITEINYKFKIVFVIWIGTHHDYNKIDAKTIEYEG